MIQMTFEEEQKFKKLNDALGLRRADYPSLHSQLDMLWHMMDDEVISGKGSVWYNTIKDIKERYPKVEE